MVRRAAMTSTSSSLVLGCATRLAPRYFEPFVRSLRATGYKGRLGLVLGNYEENEARALDELADFSVRVDCQYQTVSQPVVSVLRSMREARRVRRAYPLTFSMVAVATRRQRRVPRWRAFEYQLEGLQALRYGHYRDIILSADPAPDQVLLTDVRDVLFQSEPFDESVGGLEVYLEDPSLTIGSEPRNRRWILDLYGPREVAALGRQVVSCSGTVVGRRAEVLDYLSAMSQEITRHRCPLGSHDQGVHNHLLRRGLLGSVTIVQNGHGRVLTMGGMPSIRRDTEGRVLNIDGTMPAVLHQYDRHTGLATDLIGRLGRSE